MNSGIIEEIMQLPGEHEKNIFGKFDEHIKKIERALHVTLISRDGDLRILGRKMRRIRPAVFWSSCWPCHSGEQRLQSRMSPTASLWLWKRRNLP